MSAPIGCEPRDVARSVPLRVLLRNLGVRIRGSKRADCPLCKGTSTATLAFTERLWRCHRCNEGGDVFTLVQKIQRCGFRAAFRYVADLAGIRVENEATPALRRQWDEQKRSRERIATAAEVLAGMERTMRIEVRNALHEFERGLRLKQERLAHLLFSGSAEAFKGETDSLHRLVNLATWVIRYDLAPAYHILSFANLRERTAYILSDPDKQIEITRSVAERGYVTTEAGYRMEVACE